MAETGLRKAAEILFLVGAILGTFGTLLMVAMAAGMGILFESMGDGATFIPILYGALALVLAGGTVATFVAWSRARAGDHDAAFVWGLVGALLPPVQLIPLLAAVFCKVPDA